MVYFEILDIVLQDRSLAPFEIRAVIWKLSKSFCFTFNIISQRDSKMQFLQLHNFNNFAKMPQNSILALISDFDPWFISNSSTYPFFYITTFAIEVPLHCQEPSPELFSGKETSIFLVH